MTAPAGTLDLRDVFPPGSFAFLAESSAELPNVAAGDYIVCRPGRPDAGQYAAVGIDGWLEIWRAAGDGQLTRGAFTMPANDRGVRVLGVVVGVVRRHRDTEW